MSNYLDERVVYKPSPEETARYKHQLQNTTRAMVKAGADLLDHKIKWYDPVCERKALEGIAFDLYWAMRNAEQ